MEKNRSNRQSLHLIRILICVCNIVDLVAVLVDDYTAASLICWDAIARSTKVEDLVYR
jgi:hypothetical protein